MRGQRTGIAPSSTLKATKKITLCTCGSGRSSPNLLTGGMAKPAISCEDNETAGHMSQAAAHQGLPDVRTSVSPHPEPSLVPLPPGKVQPGLDWSDKTKGVVMRRTLSLLLLSGALGGGIAVAPIAASQALAASQAVAAPQAVPGCANNDYACGYQMGYIKGFAAGRAAKRARLCAKSHMPFSLTTKTQSDQGFDDGFSTAFATYCPA